MLQNRVLCLLLLSVCYTVTIVMYTIYCVLLACSAGSYGEGCRLTCDCGGAPCDPVTGQCICPAGKTGDSCQEGTILLNSFFFVLVLILT